MKPAADPADIAIVDQCASCGASMAPSAQWCGQCYAVRAAAATMSGGPFSPTVPAGPSHFVAAETVPAGSIMSGTRASEKQAFVPLVAKTRWGKTPTTFGPVGRVVCTLLLVLPLPPLVAWGIFSGGFEAGGAVAWGLFVMPIGLKDVWKVGTVPLN